MKLDKEVKRKAEFAGSVVEILSLAGPPGTNHYAQNWANWTWKWGVDRVPSLAHLEEGQVKEIMKGYYEIIKCNDDTSSLQAVITEYFDSRLD